MRQAISEMFEYLVRAGWRDLLDLGLKAIAWQVVFWGLLLASAWLITSGAWALALAFLCLFLICVEW